MIGGKIKSTWYLSSFKNNKYSIGQQQLDLENPKKPHQNLSCHQNNDVLSATKILKLQNFCSDIESE